MEKETNKNSSIVKFLFGLTGLTILILLFYSVGYIIRPYIKIDSSDNIATLVVGFLVVGLVVFCSILIIGVIKLMGEILYDEYKGFIKNKKEKK